MNLRIDSSWIRIDEEFDSNGERVQPQFAKMARTEGGMIVGRIVRAEEKKFSAQKWKNATFVDVSSASSFDDAFRALESSI
jgi:hypothetical protein